VLPVDTIPSRQWLDAAFRSRGLPTPRVQINANSIPLLPRLIARTDLLSFLSRHTLGEGGRHSALREVPLKETTLRRKLGVTYRKQGYLSPAALRPFTSALGGSGERTGARPTASRSL
jgi:DNA-binding transcriptional LysR family regulator